APSFAYFAKGGMPLLFTRGPSPQLLLIPPFAESAKAGAPDPWSMVTEFSRTLFSPAIMPGQRQRLYSR
ncbi:MAG: hypothetical protein WA510_01610, partial [Acidobacteriaceae bacterium]